MGKIVKTFALTLAALTLVVLIGPNDLSLKLFIVAVEEAAALTALSTLATALSSKKPIQGNSLTEQRLNKQIDPETPRKIVFGNTIAPIDLRYWETYGTDNTKYDEVIVVATHEIESFGDFYIEGQKHIFDGIGNSTILGTAFNRATRTVGVTSTSLAVGAGAKWTAASSMTGMAFYVLKYIYSQDAWPQGFPNRITQVIKGAKVYDPRLDSTVPGGAGTHRISNQATWQYNDGITDIGRNPALQALWYLLGWKINGELVAGMGVETNSINLQGFIQAANDADTQGFFSDCALSTGDNHEANIGVIEASCSGRLLDPGGLYTFKTAIDDTASIAVALDENDIIGGFEWVPSKKLRDQANIINGQYIDPGSLYQPRSFPEVRDATFIANDGFKRRANNVYAAVQDPAQAQKLAWIQLKETRFQGVFKAPFNYRAFQAVNWDVVTLSLPQYNFVNKLFRIIAYELSTEGAISLTLEETDPSIYVSGTITTVPAASIGSAYNARDRIAIGTPAVTAVAVNSDGVDTQDGLKVTYTLPSTNVKWVEILYKRSADTIFIATPNIPGTESSYIITSLSPSTSYDVKLRTVSISNVPGNYTSVIVTTTGNNSVTDFSNVGGANKPANGATVGAVQGTDLYKSGGINLYGINELENGQITLNAGGYLNNIGTATPVQNTKITVDAAGILQGIGTANKYIDNADLGISGAGQLSYKNGTINLGAVTYGGLGGKALGLKDLALVGTDLASPSGNVLAQANILNSRTGSDLYTNRSFDQWAGTELLGWSLVVGTAAQMTKVTVLDSLEGGSVLQLNNYVQLNGESIPYEAATVLGTNLHVKARYRVVSDGTGGSANISIGLLGLNANKSIIDFSYPVVNNENHTTAEGWLTVDKLIDVAAWYPITGVKYVKPIIINQYKVTPDTGAAIQIDYVHIFELALASDTTLVNAIPAATVTGNAQTGFNLTTFNGTTIDASSFGTLVLNDLDPTSNTKLTGIAPLADVTGANTSADTTLVNTVPAATVTSNAQTGKDLTTFNGTTIDASSFGTLVLNDLDPTSNTKLVGIAPLADVTSAHTSADTTLVNAIPAATVTSNAQTGFNLTTFNGTTIDASSFGTLVLNDLDPTSNTKLVGIAPLADVTGANTALNITNQGALAIKSFADWSTQINGAGKPQDNASASSFTLVGTANKILIDGNQVSKIAGTGYDAQFYSKESYTGGCFVSFTTPNVTNQVMVALNTDPLLDPSYTSLDYAIYITLNPTIPTVIIYESGISKAQIGAYAVGDSFSIIYDGYDIKYYHNGSLIYTSTVPGINKKLYLDSTFYNIGDTVTNLNFGPIASAPWQGIGSRPTELTDGRVASGLNSGGFLDFSRAHLNKSLLNVDSTANTKLTGIAPLATVGAIWGNNVSARPIELTDGRVASGLSSNGQLAQNLKYSTLMDQGNGVGRTPLVGLETGTARNGDAITFSKPYSSIPSVQWLPSGKTTDATLIGDVVTSYDALNLTTTGFTASILLKELAGTPASHADTLAGASPYDFGIVKTATTPANAWDNTYTFNGSVTVQNVGTYAQGQCLVGLYVLASGTTWVKYGSVTLFGEVGAFTTLRTFSASVTVTGVTNMAGSQFAVMLESSLAPGSVITGFTNVTYSTATAPNSANAVPVGAPPTPYRIFQ